MLSQVLPKSEISARENLYWLFLLRNLMLASETLVILISVYGLDLPLNQKGLWSIIFSLGIVNIYTFLRLRTKDPVTELEIFAQLILDVLGLAALLYLTGGATNPIIWIFLLPLILTAIILPAVYAWSMVILTCLFYTFLIAFHAPLPSIEPHHIHKDMAMFSDKQYFDLHVFGMWFGFVFSAALVAYFVVGLSKTLSERERKLSEVHANQLRNERVVALGTLAASAAHDMGTPLGTMAIIVHELEGSFPEHRFNDLHEKTQIMKQQIERCKQALSLMSASAGEMRAESGQLMELTEYLDEVINQWRSQKPGERLNFSVNPQTNQKVYLISEQTLTHSLINILNNAAEVSSREQGIRLNVNWDSQRVTIIIEDSGTGFSPQVLKIAGKEPISTKEQGMGVGLFLAYTTMRHLKGTIKLYNLKTSGAGVEMTLPLLAPRESE